MIVDEQTTSSQAGFSAVEVMVALSFLAVAIMGFFQTIISSQVVARGTRELNLANGAINRAIEDFYSACRTDFAAALTDYSTGSVTPSVPAALGTGATMTLTLLLDEQQINPPVDLNADGDCLDTVAPADATAAALQVTLTWTGILGSRRLESVTLLARGEL